MTDNENRDPLEILKDKFESLYSPRDPQKKKDDLSHLLSRKESVPGEELRKMLGKLPEGSPSAPVES